MATTITSLTPLPDYPVRGDAQATFTSKANAYVAAQNVTFNTDLPVFISQVNTVATETETARDAAQTAQTAAETAETGAELAETNAGTEADRSEAAADRAEGVINYRGLWSDATGSATAGGSYAHEGTLWLLLVAVGDITATEPDLGNSDWLRVSLPSTFDADAVTTMDLDFANGRYMVDDGERLETSGAGEVLDIVRASVVNAEGPNGLIREVPAGVLAREWRLGSKRGALVQNESENVILHSQDFTNAAWIKSSVTVTGTTETDPEGGSTASLLEKTASSAASIRQEVTASLTDNTASIYVKSGTLTEATVLFSENGGGTILDRAVINLETGAVTNVNGMVYSEQHQDGWWRVWATATITQSPIRLWLYPGDYTDSVAGDIIAWGGQIEEGASPSSYIPTTTTTVTRAADDISRALGAEFNPNSFSVYIEQSTPDPEVDPFGRRPLTLHDGSNDNRIYIYNRSGESGGVLVTSGGVTQVSQSSGVTGASFVRTLVSCDSESGLLVSINGVATTYPSGSVPAALTTMGIGRDAFGIESLKESVKRIRLCSISLTADQANAITALEP